jgi:hypothetical protein
VATPSNKKYAVARKIPALVFIYADSEGRLFPVFGLLVCVAISLKVRKLPYFSMLNGSNVSLNGNER